MISTSEPITGPQKRMLMTLASTCFGFDRESRLKVVSYIVGRPIDSITRLTKDETIIVLDMLDFTWKIAQIHEAEDKGFETGHHANNYTSIWENNQILAEVDVIDSLIDYGKKNLGLSDSHQIELASYYFNRHLTTLRSLNSIEADALWRNYRFSRKLIKNYTLLIGS